MNPSIDCGYRTDFAAYLLDLLDFMDEKIAEARNDPSSRRAALAEAAGAIPIINNRLHREDQTVLAQLMLIGFVEADIEAMTVLPDGEFTQKADDFRRLISVARNVVNART
jgi:hypothetical protein